MDIEAMNRINALLREDNTLQEKIGQMSKEAENIREYCISAINDCEETYKYVSKFVVDNSYLFTRKGSSIEVRDDKNLLFEIGYAEREEGKRSIDKVIDESGRIISGGLIDYLGIVFGYQFEEARKKVMEATDFPTLNSLYCQANRTKDWSARLLHSLEKGMEMVVENRRGVMEKGIQCASQRYEKVK